MSIESNNSSSERSEKIRLAKERITGNYLLQHDDFTTETAAKGFVVSVDGGDKEMDPDVWLSERLAVLEQKEKEAPAFAKLPNDLKADFDSRQGN